MPFFCSGGFTPPLEAAADAAFVAQAILPVLFFLWVVGVPSFAFKPGSSHQTWKPWAGPTTVLSTGNSYVSPLCVQVNPYGH